MVSALTEMRRDIVSAIQEAGVKATEFALESASPPLACVVPGVPYLSRESAQNLGPGEWAVSHLVFVITSAGTNQRQYEELDELIETVLDALSGFDVIDVSEPQRITISNGNYLGVIVQIETIERV